MSQQAAEQAHEISQVAQEVSEAINGLVEINRMVEQVKECAAPKQELAALKEQGVACYAEQMDRLLMALNSARATGLKVERVDR